METLLTTIETCRQQNRNVFEFVTSTVEAHFHHQSTPVTSPRRVNGYHTTDTVATIYELLKPWRHDRDGIKEVLRLIRDKFEAGELVQELIQE